MPRRTPARACSIATALAAMFLAPGALAGGTEVWTFDILTSGNDVFFTSPTQVDPSADQYEGTHTIDLVQVMVSFFGIPFGPFNVTGQVPPEFLTGTATVDGPTPITLLDDTIIAPEPPDPPAVSAHLVIALNGKGFGELSATEVDLGTVSVNLGFPFGTVTANVTSIRIAGDIAVTPIDLAPDPDFNNDGFVDGADLGTLLLAWGKGDSQTDLNEDGIVDGADLGILLLNWT